MEIRKTKTLPARYPVGLRAGFGAAGQRRGTAEPFRHELIAPIGTRDRTEKFVFPDAEMIQKNAVGGKRVTEWPHEVRSQRTCKVMPGFVDQAWEPHAACKHICGTAEIH